MAARWRSAPRRGRSSSPASSSPTGPPRIWPRRFRGRSRVRECPLICCALYDEHEERARRTEALQRAESEFDPLPFDAEAARVYGRVTAAVVAAGRKPRRRIADLMIAATAIAEDLPLFTTNPGDYAGLEKLLCIAPVTRPPLPHEQKPDPR
jgi:predicted nucleic acid-binding protein